MSVELPGPDDVIVTAIKQSPTRPGDPVRDAWIVLQQGHMVTTKASEAEALELACDIAAARRVGCYLWDENGMQTVDCAPLRNTGGIRSDRR